MAGEPENLVNDARRRGQKSHLWAWVALLIVIIFISVIRIRLLDVPLERDEGEYAYSGQLMLQGIPPYEKAYNMKMPGIYAAYALILAIFGQTHTGIHLGLLFINAATTVLVFLLAKDLFDPVAGLVAGSAYALLSIGQHVQGFSANAEHFVLLPALAAILLLRRAVRLQKYFLFFLAGLLFGIAFLMKQHGAAFIIFAAGYLFFIYLCSRRINRNFLLFGSVLLVMGALLPFMLNCLILWWCGVFSKFWFWTFDYARQYVSLRPFNIGFFFLKRRMAEISGSAISLWGLAIVGLSYLILSSKFRRHLPFVAGFLIFSFLAVCPGLYFNPHYFILILPAVALLAGVGIAFIFDVFARGKSILVSKVIPIVLTVAIIGYSLYQQRLFFFVMNPVEILRSSYGFNPFPESLEIARFIKENSSKDDTIAVIGSEPQIYFYSDRRSATGYIYTYPLMENQPYAGRMQQEMIYQVSQTMPKFLILVGAPNSWFGLFGPGYEERIFKFFERFPLQYYHFVCTADILPGKATMYRWGNQASLNSLKSLYWIAILRHNQYGDPNNISLSNQYREKHTIQ